nr:MAG: RNA-dependent RNA polymerase [Enamovirus sp.]
MANSTAFIILAFFSWFLLPSVGQPLPQFGTSLDAGSNQYQAGTLSLVVPPLLLRDLEFTPPDSDYVWPSRSDEDQEEKPSRSKHTGQSQIVYTWTWPSWNCSNSQCLIVISIPSWRWTLQRLESLAREWDLLSTYQHFSGLLIQIPGFTLHCAGETLIYLATLIEYVLVSWNACLYYVLSHVVKAIPGQVAVSVALLSLASWVWPKQILSYVISICAFPLISTRYGTSILRWVVSQCFSWTWSITTIWLTLPWTILMMISQTMVNIVLKKKKTKKVSKKSLKAKLKIAKATKKRTIKAPSSPTEERTIPGVSVKKLREDPPPGLILRCSDSFGQHIGYASAIKLEDKQTGILLPIHVWKDSTTISGPNGKLPLTNFQPIYDCISHDSLIMTSSSAGWGSILGARPRPLETIEAVRLKNYSLFTERDGPLSAGRDGKWFVQAARFIAPANGMFRVVSDTAPGDSGLPLLDMKMNVVAMHRGCWPESSGFPENRCVAILPVPGLTCPSSPKFTGCESYTETEAAYDMSEGFSDGEEVVVRTKGYDYNTYVGASRIATLKVSTLERELRKGPIGLWYHSDEDESATRSGKWIKPVDSGKTKSPLLFTCPIWAKGRGVCSCHNLPFFTPGFKQQKWKPKNYKKVGDDPRAEESRQPAQETSKVSEEAEASFGQHHLDIDPNCQRFDRSSRESGSECEATKIESIFQGFYRWREPKPEAPGFNSVGTCPFTIFRTPPKGLSEWGQRVAKASPFLTTCTEKYCWPDTGASAELSSLLYQAERRQSAETTAIIPPEDVRRELIRRTTEAYKTTALPAPMWAHNFDPDHMKFEFWECLRKLKGQAGSGVPYAAFNNRRTNDKWVFDHESASDLWEIVRVRLFRLLNQDFLDPVQAVKDGLVDPIRLFVKQEPHKMEKIRNKRYRLIASVSIVDQLVARMLFREQNEEELAQHTVIPSKPGLGFSQDQQVESFTRSVATLAGTTAEDLVDNWSKYLIPTDCSGFDWSVPMWLLEDELAVRNELTLGIPPGLRKMRETWLKCLGQSVFCLSNGLLLAQTSPGIQKSGSFNTSSTNSRMRFMLALYAGADWAVTMGDDALESVNSDTSQYARLGIKCERADEFDFCSHLFRAPSVVVPKNLEKMVYGLLSGTSPESTLLVDRFCWLAALQSILEEMRHCPKDFVNMLIESLGVSSLVD